jgi:hypothetical protein
MLGIGTRCSCKGWFMKIDILPIPRLHIFLLKMFVFNNMDNFKTNSSLHDFNSRSKNQIRFPSVKLTSVEKGVTYYDIQIFNHLPSNILAGQNNKTLIVSALRK